MNIVIVKNRSFLTSLVAVVLVLDLIRLVALLVMAFQNLLSPLTWIFTGIYAIVLVACIILLVRMNRSQLAFQGDGMIYTPLLGPTKEMSYSEIQKIYIGGRSYVLYNSKGKKFFQFDDFRTDKASQIVAFLKSKGVRTEM